MKDIDCLREKLNQHQQQVLQISAECVRACHTALLPDQSDGTLPQRGECSLCRLMSYARRLVRMV